MFLTVNAGKEETDEPARMEYIASAGGERIEERIRCARQALGAAQASRSADSPFFRDERRASLQLHSDENLDSAQRPFAHGANNLVQGHDIQMFHEVHAAIPRLDAINCLARDLLNRRATDVLDLISYAGGNIECPNRSGRQRTRHSGRPRHQIGRYAYLPLARVRGTEHEPVLRLRCYQSRILEERGEH